MKNHANYWVICALILLVTACASTSDSRRTLSKEERIDGLLKIAAAAVTENDTVSAIETLNQVKAMDDSIPREHLLFALKRPRQRLLSAAPGKVCAPDEWQLRELTQVALDDLAQDALHVLVVHDMRTS